MQFLHFTRASAKCCNRERGREGEGIAENVFFFFRFSLSVLGKSFVCAERTLAGPENLDIPSECTRTQCALQCSEVLCASEFRKQIKIKNRVWMRLSTRKHGWLCHCHCRCQLPVASCQLPVTGCPFVPAANGNGSCTKRFHLRWTTFDMHFCSSHLCPALPLPLSLSFTLSVYVWLCLHWHGSAICWQLDCAP